MQELAERTEACEKLRAELDALEAMVASERAAHDLGVRQAEEDRVRALRLVMSAARHVPEELRAGIEREARHLKLEHLLDPKAPRTERPVPRPEAAMAHLSTVRRERAEHAALRALELESLRQRLAGASERARDAEDELRRLVD
jgi:hypothetical protein